MLKTIRVVAIGGAALFNVNVAMMASGQEIRQQPVVQNIESKITCRKCEIDVRQAVRIGTLDGDGALVGAPRAIVRNSRGQIIMATEGEAYRLKVYSPSGAFERVIGRKGKGPGEFNFVTAITLVADSLYVFDGNNSRLTILAPNFAFVRSHQLQIRVEHAKLLPNGEILANGDIRTRDKVGLPLHRLSRTGTALSSFGSDVPVYRGDAPGLAIRFLSVAPGGDTWVSHYSQYVLEHIQPTGRIDRRLVRQAKWFPPYVKPWNPTPQNAPPAIMTDVRLDAQRNLWVSAIFPRDDFAKFLSKNPKVIEGQRVYEVEDYDRMYDSYLEVIDPGKGEVLARKRFDNLIAGWIDNDHFTTYTEDEGVPYLTVWRAAFKTN